MRNTERPQNVMDIQADYRGRAFTAQLDAHEFWLTLNKGFQPLGIVMGHCMCAMGTLTHLISIAKGTFHGEVKAYTEFMHRARVVALARMQYEADELGADGVIGVDIEVKFLHHNEWIQVNAIGTAVRYVGADNGKQGNIVTIEARRPKERSSQRPHSVMDVQADYRGRAFTSNLSTEELWLMLEAGYEPLGIIISNGVSAMGQSFYWDMVFKTNFRGEVPKRFGVARGVAYDGMFAQARDLGADTIIGVKYKTLFRTHFANQWLECFITGTALRYVGEGAYQPSQLEEGSYQLKEGTYQPSQPKEGTYQPSQPKEGTYQPSQPKEGTYQPSQPKEGTYQPSQPKEGTYQPSQPKEGTYQPSQPKEGTYQPSQPKEGTYQPSQPKEGTYQPSQPKEGTYQPSQPKEGTYQPSQPKEGTHQLSQSKEGTHQLSQSKEGTHQLSQSKEGTHQPSRVKEGIHQPSRVKEGSYQPSRVKESSTALQQATSPSRTARKKQIQKIWSCGHMNRLGAYFCSVCGEVASTSPGG